MKLTDLANIRLLQGEYDKVISLTKRALTLDPLFTNAHQHLAFAYFALGDTEQLTRTLQVIDSFPDTEVYGVQGIHMAFEAARGNRSQADKALKERVQAAKDGLVSATTVAFEAVMLDDFDSAGELLLKALSEKEGLWIFPIWVRMPEQAPDSKPWQEFWRQPGVKELADLRRSYGFDPYPPTFGSGAKP